jgi:hypothetical protein
MRTVHSNYAGVLDEVQSSFMGVLVWAILINREELAQTVSNFLRIYKPHN